MKFKWDRKYLYIGVTSFCVIAASVFLLWLLFNIKTVGGMIGAAWAAFSPVIYGLVIAYLLAPVCNFLERKWFLPLSKRLSKKKPHRIGRRARTMSITVSLLFALLLIAGLLCLVVPQLVDSLRSLVISLPGYFDEVSVRLTTLLADYPEIQQLVTENLGDFSSNLTKIIESIIPQVGGLVSSISSGVMAVFGTVFNLFMGIVVSIYLLSRKEMFLAQTKKIIYAVFRPQLANSLLRNGALTHQKFGGFITAKVMDSLIIALLAYPCLLILQIPYAALCAVIIGVTNIIPIFGPIIGAVPCAFLALMDSPIKCIIFIVFIVVLQQIDANIIGPKLLSENTGIGGFWVIVSLLIGQWLFGVTGMIIAVPLFAVVYTLVRSACERKLREKELPVDTMTYDGLASIDPFTHEISYTPKPQPGEKRGLFKRFFKKKEDQQPRS